MNFTEEQQSILQEVVEYWTKRGEDTKLESFTENDVMSLFNVISGHFLLQKSDVREVQPINKDIFQCNECGKWFDLPHSLERHKQTHISSKDKIACSKCDKTFLYELALKNHMVKHIVPAKCDQCDKTFSSDEYLKEHKKTHENSKTDPLTIS